MAHELELDRTGRASFCYNEKNGNPWHQLGQQFTGAINLQDALAACNVRTASKAPLYAMTASGMAEIDSHQAIVWPSIDDPDQEVVLGVTGSRYELIQYQSVAEIAMAVVGASSNDAVLDTMGLIFDGKQFFGFIDFGDVEAVLPSGAVDRTMQGLGFLSSHDGSQAITFYTSNVRAVCNNTVTWGLKAAKNCVRIRHTARADERMSQVRDILQLAYGNDQAFTQMASQLDMMPGGFDVLSRVIRNVWPKPEGQDATDRAKKIWDTRFEKLVDLYRAPSNAGGFGDTGWAVFNTVTEFLDHVQGQDGDRRARMAIDPQSLSSQKKRVAFDALVSA
jgi:phage/plasmid-like protein (TIGR03299 family)